MLLKRKSNSTIKINGITFYYGNEINNSSVGTYVIRKTYLGIVLSEVSPILTKTISSCTFIQHASLYRTIYKSSTVRCGFMNTLV